MEHIMRILHYQPSDETTDYSVELLAAIVMQGDKYDCVRLRKPWVLLWLSSNEIELYPIHTIEPYPRPMIELLPVHLGLRLLIAYRLRDSQIFADVSKLAIRDFFPNDADT
jgi:hypothetical protein